MSATVLAPTSGHAASVGALAGLLWEGHRAEPAHHERIGEIRVLPDNQAAVIMHRVNCSPREAGVRIVTIGLNETGRRWRIVSDVFASTYVPAAPTLPVYAGEQVHLIPGSGLAKTTVKASKAKARKTGPALTKNPAVNEWSPVRPRRSSI